MDKLFKLSNPGSTLAAFQQLRALRATDQAGADRIVKDKMDECLVQLGRSYPVINVEEDSCGEGYPRAYKFFPEIFIEGHQDTEYYMRVPVGYDGSYFTPADAVLVDPKQQEALERYWFNPWCTNVPVLSGFGPGVAVPEDFREPPPLYASGNLGARICFVIEGDEARQVLDRYLVAVEDYRTAVKAVFDKLREVILKGRPEGQNLSLMGGNEGFSLSLRKKHGDVIETFDCEHVILEPMKGRKGEYKVLSGNGQTRQGRELQVLLDAVSPARPDLAAFENRFFDVGNADYIGHQAFAGQYYLTCSFKDDKVPENIETVKGLRQVDIREKKWLEKTRSDLQTYNRAPPPPPPALEHLKPVLVRMQGQIKQPPVQKSGPIPR